MALQFDMSKDSWKQDYLMQQAQNQGINPYRQLGENLGTATGVIGGALGKALFPNEGQKIMSNMSNWFSPEKTDRGQYKKAYKDWKKKVDDIWATAGDDVPKSKKGEYIEKRAPGLIGERPLISDFQSEFKFTPGKGLVGLGKGIIGGAAGAIGGVGAGIYEGGKAVYKGGKQAVDASKKYLTESPDYFAGEQDSPLMKAIKKRKNKRLLEKNKKSSDYYTPSQELSDEYVGEFPVDKEFGEVDFGLPSQMYRKQTPMPGLEPLPKFEAPVPRTQTPIPAEIEAKQRRDAANTRFQSMIQPSRVYSPREQAAKQALLLQNYGPLQSILQQEKIEKYTDPIMQEKYADPILDTTNMLQGVDASNVKALPRVNPFQRGMR